MFHLTIFHYIVLFGVINAVLPVTPITLFYSTDTPTMHSFQISNIITYYSILLYLPQYVFNLYEPDDDLLVGRNTLQN